MGEPVDGLGELVSWFFGFGFGLERGALGCCGKGVRRFEEREMSVDVMRSLVGGASFGEFGGS